MECELDTVSWKGEGGGGEEAVVNLADIQKIDVKMENEIPTEGGKD